MAIASITCPNSHWSVLVCLFFSICIRLEDFIDNSTYKWRYQCQGWNRETVSGVGNRRAKRYHTPSGLRAWTFDLSPVYVNPRDVFRIDVGQGNSLHYGTVGAWMNFVLLSSLWASCRYLTFLSCNCTVALRLIQLCRYKWECRACSLNLLISGVDSPIRIPETWAG